MKNTKSYLVFGLPCVHFLALTSWVLFLSTSYMYCSIILFYNFCPVLLSNPIPTWSLLP
ncbi:hypothetical protein K445DRAFT_313311 [Daldinia sp. EC12]|nr:hypothetical protein K445DRAFT_313311 [Daldinia sp. EC12]